MGNAGTKYVQTGTLGISGCGTTSREWFAPAIRIILLNWNRFVKRNDPIFLPTIGQVRCATTGNIWLRLLLLKESDHVIKSKGSHTFSTQYWVLHVVFSKKNQECIATVCSERLRIAKVTKLLSKKKWNMEIFKMYSFMDGVHSLQNQNFRSGWLHKHAILRICVMPLVHIPSLMGRDLSQNSSRKYIYQIHKY